MADTTRPNGTSGGEHTGLVQTVYGPVRGFVDDGMRKFLGIPYAAPPVGELRWRPPKTPEPWTEPLKAVAFGPVCAQTSACFPGFGHESSTEDCLYLNVFVPAGHKIGEEQTLPVMVWIPGGGFFCGSSNGKFPHSPKDCAVRGMAFFIA